jgi:hypothetical protein
VAGSAAAPVLNTVGGLTGGASPLGAIGGVTGTVAGVANSVPVAGPAVGGLVNSLPAVGGGGGLSSASSNPNLNALPFAGVRDRSLVDHANR